MGDLLVGEVAAAGHPDDIVSELLWESLGHGDSLTARRCRAIGMSGKVGADPPNVVLRNDGLDVEGEPPSI